MLESLLAGFIMMLVSWAQPYAQQHGQTISVAETTCMAEVIYFESRGEGSEGMTAIAYTVLNRTVVRGKSICPIIHQPSQFSFYTPNHKRSIQEVAAWIQSAVIGIYAQLGVIPNPIGNATSYNTSRMSSWESSDGMIMSQKVNHHYFYTEKALYHAPPLVPSRSALGFDYDCLQVVHLLTQNDVLYHATGIPINPALTAKLDQSVLTQLSRIVVPDIKHHVDEVKVADIKTSQKFLKLFLVEKPSHQILEYRSHTCATTVTNPRKEYKAMHNASSRQLS